VVNVAIGKLPSDMIKHELMLILFRIFCLISKEYWILKTSVLQNRIKTFFRSKWSKKKVIYQRRWGRFRYDEIVRLEDGRFRVTLDNVYTLLMNTMGKGDDVSFSTARQRETLSAIHNVLGTLTKAGLKGNMKSENFRCSRQDGRCSCEKRLIKLNNLPKYSEDCMVLTRPFPGWEEGPTQVIPILRKGAIEYVSSQVWDYLFLAKCLDTGQNPTAGRYVHFCIDHLYECWSFERKDSRCRESILSVIEVLRRKFEVAYSDFISQEREAYRWNFLLRIVGILEL
jgi:hypothetical protein